MSTYSQLTGPHKQHLQTLPAQVSDQLAQCTMYEYTHYQITANKTLQLLLYRVMITLLSIISNVKCK